MKKPNSRHPDYTRVEPLCVSSTSRFCCLESRLASLLIGSLYAVYNAVLIVVCALILADGSLRAYLTRTIYDSVDGSSNVFEDTDDDQVDGRFSWSFYFYGITDLSYAQFDYWFTLWIRSQLSLAVFVLSLSLSLVYGIAAVQPCCLMPFYIWGIFDVGFTCLAVFHYTDYPTASYEFWAAVVLTLVIFVKLYWLSCIWVTYQETVSVRKRNLAQQRNVTKKVDLEMGKMTHYGVYKTYVEPVTSKQLDV
ncbi:uncharacterized protein LOC134183359 [Corticium candelabrum]|uniref:uncharacterized protein LOC134183359 n=1 Tax=Corticium candelabrum TaxID=121492 RepID=UPI002E259414|nr:uncharacterized protein LOC134183359 [Corticium candelabrum]